MHAAAAGPQPDQGIYAERGQLVDIGGLADVLTADRLVYLVADAFQETERALATGPRQARDGNVDLERCRRGGAEPVVVDGRLVGDCLDRAEGRL